MKRLLAALLVLSSCSAADALRVTSPVVSLDFTPQDIVGHSPNGKTVFSLRDMLKHQYGSNCSVKVNVTPLSFVGNRLSVQIVGHLCGQETNVVRVFSVGSAASVSRFSTSVGETALVNRLKRDPYLKEHWTLTGDSLTELDLVLTGSPFADETGCKLAPAPLGIADTSYVFWKSAAQGVNVRLALPLACGEGTVANDFSWIGLDIDLPTPLAGQVKAAVRGQSFLASNRPKVVTTIACNKP